MRELTIGKNDAGQRLDRFVAKSLPLLPPTLLQQAGLPLSDYYEYLLEMKHNTPVVTAANDYMKVDGSTAEYGADPALDEWAKGYLMLEYNNIGAHAKRDQSIFDPAE